MDKKRVTLKMANTAIAYLSRGKKSYGNMTQSVSENYDVKNRHNAATLGSELLDNPRFRNHLEELAESMGMGIQVRLGIAQAVALGKIQSKTVVKSFSRDKSGKMVLSSRTETVADPTPDARVRAVRAIDKATGHDEMLRQDSAEAQRILDDMYADALTPAVLADIERAIDGSDVDTPST